MKEIIFSLFFAAVLFISPLSAEKKFVNAIWYNAYQMDLRNEQKAKAEIDGHFKKLSEMKIDSVFFLVKHPDGRLYYRSKFGQTACDWDPLSYVIAECRRYGMSIHPYLNVFAEEGDYLKQHPEQAERRKDGTPQQWACPANPEVRRRMLGMIRELASNYEIDGIQLDRIRYEDYPASDSGFNPCSLELFKAKFGKEALPNDPDFVAFKCAFISSFVEEASALVRSIDPKLQFSCAVYPTHEKSIKYAAQDWGLWVRKGWVDAIYPMGYTEDPDAFDKYLAESAATLEAAGNDTKLVMGLGAYKEKMRAESLEKEIGMCLNNPEVSGVCYFNGYSLLREDFETILKRIEKKKGEALPLP